MKNFKVLVGPFLVLFISASFVISAVAQQKTDGTKKEIKKPKNIIFMVADGTGLSQISTAFFKEGYDPHYARFKSIGLSETSSTFEVTDSAAGATAFSIGEKTYNGSIGKDKDHHDKELITEKLINDGFSFGLAVTSSVTHATPASFYAHVETRSMEESIAKQLIQAKVDFFAGGGQKFFFDRSDSVDLTGEVKKAKIELHTDGDLSFPCESKRCGYLYGENGMKRMTEGRGVFLEKASMAGIEHLDKISKKNGFFMLIEGSQIDWAGHENNIEYLKQELIDFDQTIGKVLDWAEKDGETLVVVTADHETGGLALAGTVKNFVGNVSNDYSKIEEKFTTNGHTATLVPVFAFGPGEELFRGTYPNNTIYNKFLEALYSDNR